MIRTVLAVAALATCTFAHAATPATPGSASITFRDMTVSVADLDPNDAIVPSVTANGNLFGVYLEAAVVHEAPGGSNLPLPGSGTFQTTFPDPIPAIHYSLGDGEVRVELHTQLGASLTSPFTISVAAKTALADVNKPQNAWATLLVTLPVAVPNGAEGGNYLLSPYSSLTLRGNMDLHASFLTDLGVPGGQTTGGAYYTVGAEIYFGSYALNQDLYQQLILDFQSQVEDFSMPIEMTLINDTASSAPVYLVFNSSVLASASLDPVATVPEAESVNLALAGLATLGLAAWRRRAQVKGAASAV